MSAASRRAARAIGSPQLLEALSGESIWSAYGPHRDSSRLVTAGPAATGRPNWRLVLLPVLLLLLAAPVALGYDLQVVALNAFGFGWAGWLVRRILLDRLRLHGGGAAANATPPSPTPHEGPSLKAALVRCQTGDAHSPETQSHVHSERRPR